MPAVSCHRRCPGNTSPIVLDAAIPCGSARFVALAEKKPQKGPCHGGVRFDLGLPEALTVMRPGRVGAAL